MKKNKMGSLVKNLILIGFLSLVLMISGCSIPGFSDDKESGIFGGGSSNKDGNGVSLIADENSFPSEMIKGQTVNFGFVFTNYQEHDITDMKVRTSGYETGYVSGLNKDYTISKIPKATEQTGPGILSWSSVKGVKVDGFSKKYNFNPKFDYCYTAKTTYGKQICVPSSKNSCDVKIEPYENQNGPLKVSINKIISSDNKIIIYMDLSDISGGQVVNECFKTDDYTNSYSKPVVKLGSTIGSCTAISGEVIVNGKSSFYCEFPRTGDDSYSSQVSVEFHYLYQQSLKKSIVVKDINNGYN